MGGADGGASLAASGRNDDLLPTAAAADDAHPGGADRGAAPQRLALRPARDPIWEAPQRLRCQCRLPAARPPRGSI